MRLNRSKVCLERGGAALSTGCGQGLSGILEQSSTRLVLMPTAKPQDVTIDLGAMSEPQKSSRHFFAAFSGAREMGQGAGT